VGTQPLKALQPVVGVGVTVDVCVVVAVTVAVGVNVDVGTVVAVEVTVDDTTGVWVTVAGRTVDVSVLVGMGAGPPKLSCARISPSGYPSVGDWV